MQEGDQTETPGQSIAITVGIVSDTHVPDRCRDLHPELLPALERARVGAILHAGDIAVPGVLEKLEHLAPVAAVRGNRDWVFRRTLPWSQRLEFAGVPVVLVHGHGTWFNYLLDKVKYYTQGYNLKRYQAAMAIGTAGAKVIIFGHTHQPENIWHNGQLWFNPGSASIKPMIKKYPTFGLLYFYENGRVEGEMIELKGAHLEHRQWVKD
jgi:putative phosphoesterase